MEQKAQAAPSVLEHRVAVFAMPKSEYPSKSHVSGSILYCKTKSLISRSSGFESPIKAF